VKERGCVEQRQNSTAHLKIQELLSGDVISGRLSQGIIKDLMDVGRAGGGAVGLARGRPTVGLRAAASSGIGLDKELLIRF